MYEVSRGEQSLVSYEIKDPSRSPGSAFLAREIEPGEKRDEER